ncbi:Tyrosine kinase domain-containing protein [Rhizoctonia solani]|uniref:Tyrosine kinase domain-containing protein n=1 Tax=Rhizoctonia solani TaxID=456999 RepID=A0A8H8P1G0_9AGAM|nr:Tyrosine kinase domain-containing protein [Rhizoctonia solani]QRW22788.1 Tyrosine kinase domain-containing protein [Rhizoctonia solani]
MIEIIDDGHGEEHMMEAEQLLDDIQRLCERQWLQKEACRDLYERHVDFQSQLRFVRNHKPHVDEDYDFCREGGKMELHTIIEFFNLLTHTAHLSKFRALFEREKIIRALRALHEAYSRGIAHVHTFLPESHALFQPPPSPGPSDNDSRGSTIGPHTPGPGADRIREHGRQESVGSYENAAGLGAGAGVAQENPKSLLPLSLPPNPNPNPDMSMPTPQTDISPEAGPPAYGYGFTDNKPPIMPEKPRLSLERTTSNDRRAQSSPLARSHTPPTGRTLTPQDGRGGTPTGQVPSVGTPGPKFPMPHGTPGPRLGTPLGFGARTPTPQGSVRRPPTMMPPGQDSDRPRKGSAELDPERSGRKIDKVEMERLRKMEKEKVELERIARLGNESDARAAINAIARGEDYWETFGTKPRHEVMMFLAAVQQEMYRHPLTSKIHKELDNALLKAHLRSGIVPPVHTFQPSEVTQFSAQPITYTPYADVYKALLKGYALASRRFDALQVAQVQAEVKMWAHFRHQNILRILGVTAHKHMTSCMVSPWMPRGNAHQFVIDNPDVSPIRILMGTALGLGYLHDQGIPHADLRGANILIDDQGEALLSDYGLANFYAEITGHCILNRWTPPETLDPTTVAQSRTARLAYPPINITGDIHAFGLVIVELATRAVPFHNIHREEAVYARLVRGIRPPRPNNLDDDLWALAQRCWSFPPAARLTAPNVVASLRELQKVLDPTGHLVFAQQSPPAPVGTPSTHPDDEFVKVAVRAPAGQPKAFSRKLLIVVTTDGEKYVVVDVSAANTGMAIKEKIMTAVKIPDRERSQYLIFRTEIGEYIVGDALNSELLYKTCVEHGDSKGNLKLIVVNRTAIKAMPRTVSLLSDMRSPSMLLLTGQGQGPGTGLPTPSPSPGPGPSPDSTHSHPTTTTDVAIQARVPRTAVSRTPRFDSSFTKTTAATVSEYQLSLDERRLTPQPPSNLPRGFIDERFEYENKSVASNSSVAQMDAEIRATNSGNHLGKPVSRSAIAVLHFERNVAPCEGCGRHFAGIYSLEKHLQSQGGTCKNPDLATELHRLELESRPITEVTDLTQTVRTSEKSTPKPMPPLLSRVNTSVNASVNTNKALPAPPRPPRGDSVDGPGPMGWAPVTPPTATKVLTKAVDLSQLKKQLKHKFGPDANEFRGGPRSGGRI